MVVCIWNSCHIWLYTRPSMASSIQPVVATTTSGRPLSAYLWPYINLNQLHKTTSCTFGFQFSRHLTCNQNVSVQTSQLIWMSIKQSPCQLLVGRTCLMYITVTINQTGLVQYGILDSSSDWTPVVQRTEIYMSVWISPGNNQADRIKEASH